MQHIQQHDEIDCDNAAQAYRQALNKHFYVKKRALFRKGEQLAQFCNSQVFISIFNNETGKIFSFTSHEEFNLEKITQLVLRDVQYGASLNKNKKFLDENFEDIRKNIKQMQEIETNVASLDNHMAQESGAQIKSRMESQLKKIEKKKEAPVTVTHQQQPRSLAEVAKLLAFDDEDMFEYKAQVQPHMNRVCSGLLAMNQARDKRNSGHLSRQDSVASQTATVSNDNEQEDQEQEINFVEDFEQKPYGLIHQDSVIPRTSRSQQAINPALVASIFNTQEDF